MGCDIHIVLERRKTDKPCAKWIGVTATDHHPGPRIPVAQRDYDFFAEVANVRGKGTHYPRNLPEDVSELAWEQYMRSPRDHHSPSHMPLDEFCAAYAKVNPTKVRAEFAGSDLFGVYGDDGFDYRVVFWFDN
jgi:hypothetical protein